MTKTPFTKANPLAPRWLLGATASTLALMIALPAAAQDEASAAEDAEDSIITVTGSRIRTDGMQAPVPVTVVQPSRATKRPASSLRTSCR